VSILITKFDCKNNLDIPIYLSKQESNTASSVGNNVKIINCSRNGEGKILVRAPPSIVRCRMRTEKSLVLQWKI